MPQNQNMTSRTIPKGNWKLIIRCLTSPFCEKIQMACRLFEKLIVIYTPYYYQDTVEIMNICTLKKNGWLHTRGPWFNFNPSIDK